MRTNKTFCARQTEGLTSADVTRLSRNSNVVIRDGDLLIILEGSKIIEKTLSENGLAKLDKQGNPIKEYSVIAIVKRHDTNKVFTTQIQLVWLRGKDLTSDSICPLYPCKDGSRKYAATHTLNLISDREGIDFGFYEGQKQFDNTLILTGSGFIEGYQLPQFSDVWEKSNNGYRNKPEIAGLEELQLKKVKRTILTYSDYKIGKSEFDKLSKIQSVAESFIQHTA